MLKFLGVAFATVVLCVLVIVLVALSKPATFRVERSIDVAAPPAKITPLIADFHNWKQWSPWEHLDPNQKVQFTGAQSGTGAIYDWQGNRKAGKGHMEILSATPTETRIHLLFYEPFPGDNLTTFTYAPTSTGTHVVWEMHGPVSFGGKIMSVFSSMDKMIGPDFDRGLASIKALAEK